MDIAAVVATGATPVAPPIRAMVRFLPIIEPLPSVDLSVDLSKKMRTLARKNLPPPDVGRQPQQGGRGRLRTPRAGAGVLNLPESLRSPVELADPVPRLEVMDQLTSSQGPTRIRA